MSRRPDIVVFLFAALTLTAPVLGTPPATDSEPLIIGVHPYRPDQTLRESFRPLADLVAAVADRPVEIRVGADYEEHMHAIGTGVVDVGFLGPTTYVNLTRLFGPVRLLGRLETRGQPTFHGHLVVAKESPVRTLADLAGRRLAFVDPYSTMYVVPMAMLRSAGLSREDLAGQAFLGSHHNVALGVLSGDYAGGAIKDEVFERFAERGLRSLQATMEIPEHVFVAGEGLDPDLAAKITTALCELGGSDEGRAVLRRIKSSATGIVPAADEDFDPLRELLRISEPVTR